MAYAAISRVTVGQLFTEPMYEQIRENFAQGIPGKYTAKGQILAATGNQTTGLVAPTANGQALIVDTAEAAGLKFAGGTAPIGIIILWSGSTGNIPSGWQLCNGVGGTPDLRGRFVVGAGSTYAVGATGGGSSTNLAHTHSTNAGTSDATTDTHFHSQGSTGGGSAHSHAIVAGTTGQGSNSEVCNPGGVNKADASHTHNFSGSTDSSSGHTHTNPTTNNGGSSHTHSIAASTTDSQLGSTTFLPEYYALAYIQRVS